MFLKKVIRTTTLEVDANIDELIKGLMEESGICEIKHHNTIGTVESLGIGFYCFKDGSFIYSINSKPKKTFSYFDSLPFFIRGKLYASDLDKTKIKIEHVRNNNIFLIILLDSLFATILLLPFSFLLYSKLNSIFLSVFLLYLICFFTCLRRPLVTYIQERKHCNINLSNMQEDFFKKVKKITEDKNEIKHIL